MASPQPAGSAQSMPAHLPADLRHVSQWSTAPSAPPRRRPTYEVAVLGILLVWNIAANLFTPDEASLPLGIVGASLLVVLARRSGLSWDYLGMRTESVGAGLRLGAAVAAIVVAAIGAVAAIPASRELLADDRFLGLGIPEMLYETLVRIPIGTALGEEVAFRGVVLGMLLLWVSPLRAVLVSSALFGLWHLLPAIDALDTNPAGDLASGDVATVVGVGLQVIITGIVGAGFAWLRFRSRSIAAPALAHWAINATAYAAGWLVVRNGWA